MTIPAPEIPQLEFAPILRREIIRLIPTELIESVKGKTFTPDQFYSYHEEQSDNPYNMLYAVIDKGKKIQGYLWAEINLLDKSLFVNTFSVSKEYWGKGKAIPLVVEFLKELKKKLGSPRIYWITTNDKFFSKHGFKRSKNVLMEYNLE